MATLKLIPPHLGVKPLVRGPTNLDSMSALVAEMRARSEGSDSYGKIAKSIAKVAGAYKGMGGGGTGLPIPPLADYPDISSGMVENANAALGGPTMENAFAQEPGEYLGSIGGEGGAGAEIAGGVGGAAGGIGGTGAALADYPALSSGLQEALGASAAGPTVGNAAALGTGAGAAGAGSGAAAFEGSVASAEGASAAAPAAGAGIGPVAGTAAVIAIPLAAKRLTETGYLFGHPKTHPYSSAEAIESNNIESQGFTGFNALSDADKAEILDQAQKDGFLGTTAVGPNTYDTQAGKWANPWYIVPPNNSTETTFGKGKKSEGHNFETGEDRGNKEKWAAFKKQLEAKGVTVPDNPAGGNQRDKQGKLAPSSVDQAKVETHARMLSPAALVISDGNEKTSADFTLKFASKAKSPDEIRQLYSQLGIDKDKALAKISAAEISGTITPEVAAEYRGNTELVFQSTTAGPK